MFFLILLGFPALVFFVIVSAIFIAPFFLAYKAVRVVRRVLDRPESTRRLEERFEEIKDPFPNLEEFENAQSASFEKAWSAKRPIAALFERIVRIAGALYASEELDALTPAPAGPKPIEQGRYRDELIDGIRTGANAPRILEIIDQTFADAFTEFVRKLPPSSIATSRAPGIQGAPLFQVPIAAMIRNPGQAIADLIRPFHSPQVIGYRLFEGLRNQLNRNLYEASGVRDGAPVHKLIHPYEHPGSAREIVKAYLGYTPLQYLFDVEVPFPVDRDRRMEHWHLIGSSGWGKSQTLQHIIMHDVSEADPPALVIVDSQGDMLAKIQRLEIFARDPDRLIIIDPEYDPSLNMFDVATDRLADYSPIVREQVQAGIIELYAYIFGAIASDLTAKQGTAFAFVVRLMLAIPGATLHTLLELMEDSSKSFGESPFAPYAAKLDNTARSFFDNQFFNKQAFGATRQQIARRLYAVLSVPAFDRMFSAKRNKLDMFAAIQGRKVVLINTAKSLLKSDASALFGRTMIARVMAAAFERVAVPYAERTPAYLIIDEAAEYFDESLESLLSQARKFRLGVLFAHQHMEQLTPALRSSVAANTSIKMAGGVSDRDARMLDADMRTTSEFIASMHKDSRATEFAAYIRNETPTAVRLKIPFGTIEGAPRMSTDQHRQLIERNRARFSAEPPELRPEERSDERASSSPPGGRTDSEVRPSKNW
jgi:hypothetical protein